MSQTVNYKKHIFRNILLLIILAACIYALILIIHPKEDYNHFAENGVLDLTGYHASSDGIIKLNGEWKYHHNQFTFCDNANMILVDVPSTWNKYRVDDEYLDYTGYCTYRLSVTNCMPNEPLAISINTIPSAYAVFINDHRIGGCGNVGQSSHEEIPQMKNEIIFFTAPDEDFDINIHVSNFHYSKGGLWADIYLGSNNKIVEYSQYLIGKDFFIIGIPFIIAVLYGLFYFYEQRHKKYLLFVICCLLMILLIDTDRNMLILSMFND